MKKNLFILLLIIILAGMLPYYKFCYAPIAGWLYIHIFTPALEFMTGESTHNLLYWLAVWVLTAALLHILFLAIYFLTWGIVILIILAIGKKFAP